MKGHLYIIFCRNVQVIESSFVESKSCSITKTKYRREKFLKERLFD